VYKIFILKRIKSELSIIKWFSPQAFYFKAFGLKRLHKESRVESR